MKAIFTTAFLFVAIAVFGQNVTNFTAGQPLGSLMQLSTVPTSGGGADYYGILSSPSGGSLRNDYTGTVGWKGTAGTSLTVVGLRRWVVSGNSQTHVLTLYKNGTVAGTVTVNTSGAPVGWLAGTLSSPVSFSSSDVMVVESTEASGLDSWYDAMGYTFSSDFTSIFSTVAGGIAISGGQAYVPVDIVYTKP